MVEKILGDESSGNGKGEQLEGEALIVDSAAPQRSVGVFSMLSAFIQYMCFVYPTSCSCCVIASIVFGVYFVVGYLFDPTLTVGVVHDAYVGSATPLDLALSKVDHWCIGGGDFSCRCADPLEPVSRAELPRWTKAYHQNTQRAQAYSDNSDAVLDVVFLGESLVEEMDGTWLGSHPGDKGQLRVIESLFNRNFKAENSGIEGTALGIAGDTSANVLWRLRHGEMPDGFNPRVWWISLGMNDLGRMQCSEDVVVIGIRSIVEEIRARQPDAKIVVNSMLPMADFRGDLFPKLQDYRDAFRDKNGKAIQVGEGPSLKTVLVKTSQAQPGKVVSDGDKLYKRPELTTATIRKRQGAMGMMGVAGQAPKGGVAKGAAKGSPKGAPKGTVKGAPKGTVKGAAPKKDAPVAAPEAGTDPGETDGARRHRGLDSRRGGLSGSSRRQLAGMMMPAETEGMMGKTATEATVTEPTNKALLKKIKKDPVNPKLNLDRSRVKVRDPKALFTKHSQLPIWTSIAAINKELNKIYSNDESVIFFDATNIFAEIQKGSKEYVLRSDRISVRGHPTELGYAVWENKILQKLKTILEKEDEEIADEADINDLG